MNELETRDDCVARATANFCDASVPAFCGVCRTRFATVYPKGTPIFVEGQDACGVYMLCAGRVKLSTSSGRARVLITHIAEAGEILGLGAALSGDPYEVTAEALEPCRLTFIEREQFLRLLGEDGEAALRAARQLNINYRAAFEQSRLLGLSQSAAGKLARFLLESCAREPRANGASASRLILALTHEEIGQRIGASRETVTRLFSEFKQSRIIRINGATLHIRNSSALETLAKY
ncbi:MAG TPA: Crp/Fnr family transcriptional regulator [Pyrinomonadaceae bacterium]|nr:Crp/Fnr family transcriptional regulator [Pyrinomonadaceae bacterium]